MSTVKWEVQELVWERRDLFGRTVWIYSDHDIYVEIEPESSGWIADLFLRQKHLRFSARGAYGRKWAFKHFNEAKAWVLQMADTMVNADAST